jgi:hypothetical protein
MSQNHNHLNHATHGRKGRASIWIAQNVERKLRNFPGHNDRRAQTRSWISCN